MFLYVNTEKFKNYTILPDLQSPSNHAPLSVYIIIEKETIQDRKQAIVKNNREEKEFINKLKNMASCINMTNIHDYKILERAIQEFASIVEELWYKYSKNFNITKCSKTQQNKKYNRDLAKYQISKS